MSMFPLRLIPATPNIDFMRLRWISIAFAAALMLTAIGAIAFKGFNYALDFTGGTVVELRFERPADVDAVRGRLDAAGFEGAQVQTFGSGSDLLVRLQPRDTEGADDPSQLALEVVEIASGADNRAQRMGSNYVGPQVGEELAQNGVYAVLFVIIGLLIYVGFRFEWKFAVAAVLTTLNDVMIVAGWFALSGREFDLTVLAGLLSTLGFSINDTIVVFDRVRENFRGMRAGPMTVLNTSINQTLSRTIITSVAAFLTVLALGLYGGGSLQGMAEAMMIGIVAGTISTIFVACPLLTIGVLKVSKQDLLPKAKDDAELARRP